MGNQQGKIQRQNQSGRPKKMVHWKSAERPSPPGRPILIPLTDTQPDIVNLRWEKPKLDGGSPIIGYIIEHRRMGSPHWVRSIPTAIAQCEVSISGLEPGWRYHFRVFAENVVGRSEASELSDPLTVTLQRNAISVPRFIDELQDTNAVEDERIEFRVRVIGQPQPEINWFKDGYEIFSARRTKIINENDVSVLIIYQVALSDEGEIKCTATNRAGHVVTKAKLLVQAPPKIRLPRTYEDGLIVEADEILRLKVGIAGQPPPTVSWLHEGEPVSNGGRYEIVSTDRNSMLKIDSVQRIDRGEYSICAVNNLGEDITSFLVTVTSRPNPPGKVKLNMSFGKSATLSWTAPLDDGGCKIGSYIVEYFRVGWNVWLKATTTRSLTTTLNDLIEGSEYKFRVKAENPYGLSEPSEESDILFIPDPKRGIMKPKSESKLTENHETKPVPPRRKTLSPPRPHVDASTETPRLSPSLLRKPKPQLIDNEELHREMSYGTSDQAFKINVRKSPSLNSSDLTLQNTKQNEVVNIVKPTTPPPAPKSPQSVAFAESIKAQLAASKKEKEGVKEPANLMPLQPPLATPERSTTPEINKPVAAPSKHEKISPKPSPKSLPLRKTPTPPEPIAKTPALQRSAEPVELGVNQTVRRYSGHSLSPIKSAPALAIAIATGLNITENGINSNHLNEKPNVRTLTKPTIQISAPPPSTPTPSAELPSTKESKAFTDTLPASIISTAPSNPSETPLTNIDKHEDVHTSNEFMLVVFDKHSKVKDKNKEDSFELDLEDALQPPPVSISSPELASLEYTNLHTFPLRRSVSSTELLYERAMARFYEAVELEEAEKARKLKASEEKASGANIQQQPFIRKRLGSMTEAERMSFEKRSEHRRQSADIIQDLKTQTKWSSKENISTSKPLSRAKGMILPEQQISQDSEDQSGYEPLRSPLPNESFELGSDYTESTASSDQDSIEKFKMELMARTRSPSPKELDTYHPRDMTAGTFTPYRAPTPEQAAIVLNRPMPLPSPDFVPKPILKRPSTENVQTNPNGSSNAVNNNPCIEKNLNGNKEKINPGLTDKLDIAKGIKSFFKRDKRSTTEKNTEENEKLTNPQEKNMAAAIAAEEEAKRKAKEEEDLKRSEAERLMLEEAHAAVDHYSDLVREISTTHKYHKPIYLDKDELQKVAQKAAQEEVPDEDINSENIRRRGRSQSPEEFLVPPVSERPRLSISEKGQLQHVRTTASDLAVKDPKIPESPIERSRQNDQRIAPHTIITQQPPKPQHPIIVPPPIILVPQQQPRPQIQQQLRPQIQQQHRPQIQQQPRPQIQQQPHIYQPQLEMDPASFGQVISETTVENPDGRGRTRIVKVKRVIKRRVPSSTRSRESSASRPPSSLASHDRIPLNPANTQASLQQQFRKALEEQQKDLSLVLAENDLVNVNRQQLDEPLNDEDTHEKVRSALSYSTDLILFIVACYVYLFKDARLVLPILALMIYRQLGEAISAHIPNWMKRKRN